MSEWKARCAASTSSPSKPSQLALAFPLPEEKLAPVPTCERRFGRSLVRPDSKRIAFVSDTTPEDIQKAEHKKPDREGEHESDVHVISRAIVAITMRLLLDLKRRAIFGGLIWATPARQRSSARQLR